MSDQELNEKLAKWAGFEENNGLWQNPNRVALLAFEEPDFTSLDAIFEWLVQDDWQITFFPRTNEDTIICWIDRFENGDQALKVPHRYIGVDKTYASAFCNAAEQIADKEAPCTT